MGNKNIWNAQGTAFAITFSLIIILFMLSALGPTGGDSGELLAAMSTGGIAHPPGYPLFTMLGFVLGPRLISALPAAIGCGGLYLLLNVLAPGSALIFTLIYATSRIFVLLGTQVEVFALNNCILIYFLLSYVQKRFVWAAFLMGLALSNQHTSVLVTAPIACQILLRYGFSWRYVLAFFAGLLPYIYLPIAAQYHPYVSWGDTGTWPGFLHHILRRDYGTFSLGIGGWSATIAWGHTMACIWDLACDLGPVLVLLIFHQGFFSWILVGSLSFFLALMNLPLNGPMIDAVRERFWLQPTLLICIVAAQSFSKNRSIPRFAPLIMLIWTLTRTIPTLDFDQGRAFISYGHAILDHLPQKTLLFVQGDHISGILLALQRIQNVRPDVVILDQEILSHEWSVDWIQNHHPELFIRKSLQPGGMTLSDIVHAHPNRPISLIGNTIQWDHSLEKDFVQIPEGLSVRIVPKAMQSMTLPLAFGNFPALALRKYPPRDWKWRLLHEYLAARYAACIHMLMHTPDTKGALEQLLSLEKDFPHVVNDIPPWRQATAYAQKKITDSEHK